MFKGYIDKYFHKKITNKNECRIKKEKKTEINGQTKMRVAEGIYRSV
jgi:hypothetical protein